ncbi:hypothetical protein BUZ70_09220, partial [Staphylococcus saprophyticus]
ELYISIFKNFADSDICEYLIENLFVLSSKQNRHLTLCNVLSYKEHRERLRKKQALSKIEYYKWNQEQKAARENGDSDFHKKMDSMRYEFSNSN